MKAIAGYPNYSISIDGIVYNTKKNKQLKPVLSNTGYLKVTLCNNGTRKDFNLHRLIGIAYIENHNNYPMINHKNGIKSDNRLDNLEWCSASQNIQHAFDNGLKKSTERHKLKTIEKLSKPVIDTQTGIFYSSAREAAKLLGLNRNTLYGYLLGNNPNKTSLIYA